MMKIFMVAALALAFSSIAFAGGTACGTSPILAADGTTIGPDTIAPSTTYYYYMNLTAGHSYVAEVWDPFDQVSTGTAALSVVTGGTCAAGPASTNISNFEPGLIGSFANRIAWVQGSTGFYQIALGNSNATSYKYYIRLTDTTAYNPNWTTYSGYITQWGFQNTTSQPIQGTLTVVTTVGGTLANIVLNFTIPANSSVFEYGGPTQNVDIAASHAGSATFSYIGPPGGVLAFCYLLNGPTTVIVPAKFEAVRGLH